MPLTLGARVGPYEIQAVLGAGGMGEVYKARDIRLDRSVAIKVLRAELACDSAWRERFEKEARAISRLNHPHICTLYDIGREPLSETHAIDFLVMELVEGPSLGQLLARGSLPAAEVVRYGIEIAAALEDAHAHGIVHGDLKPGNVIATKFGLKLLDFGLARQIAVMPVSDLTRTRTELAPDVVAGTLPYMAPELLRGDSPDTRSDLWAMGVVLYEMATGVRPFSGETGFELAAAIINNAPATAPVWIPVGLQSIIQRCLAKSLGERYQHATEMREALRAVQSDPSIVPPAPMAAHNLPLQLTRFIGREREIAEVSSLLAAERLVTLTGAGGAGKTRLALQIAQSIVGDFAHGLWVIELAPLHDPELIPDAVVSTLRIRQESGLAVTDVLINFLRTRTMVLLLDNCEHLIAACAVLVNQILRTCSGVRVLATSREALGIAGERAWRVPSLALPELRDSGSAALLARSDAGRFFLDRAQAASPHFALTVENAPTVARICQLLDGLPLALELAAARMKVLSLEEIVARLGDRFQLLTDGSRTALPRQQTLRATIDWSYDLLSEPERRLLKRLSVFAGGCSLEAAEQVCGDDDPMASDTIGLLSNLIDKSLVVVDDDVVPARRYRLLETVRQYARDRLFESGEATAQRDRHFQFFQRLALEAEPELRGPNQVAWVGRLGADHDNLRAALEWSLARVKDTKVPPLHLVCALHRFWLQRNHFAEGRQWLERALEAGGEDIPRSLRARALVAIADLAWFQGDGPAVQASYEQVVTLDDQGLEEERWTAGFAAFLMALTALDRGELDQGVDLAEKTLAIARETGATWLTGYAAFALDIIALRRGELDRAALVMEGSIALFRSLGDKFALVTALVMHSITMVYRGDFEQAIAAAREGLLLSHEMADHRSVSWCLTELAAALAARQQVECAARLWGAAEGLSQSIGAPRPLAVRALQDLYLPSVRRTLGDGRFAAAWTEGRQMRPDVVVAYAMQDEDAE